MAGRPTDYDPAFVEQAAKLCALGATDYELTDFFGVDTRPPGPVESGLFVSRAHPPHGANLWLS